MRSFTQYLREGYARPSGDIKSEPGYLYHATNLDGARDIAREGLKPFRPDHGTDQACWPDGTCKPRVYFSPKAHVVWMFAPEHGQAVILRVKRSDGSFRNELGTGDVYSEAKVSAKVLEIMKADGTWVSLSKGLNESTLLRESLKSHVRTVASMSSVAQLAQSGRRHPVVLLRDHGRTMPFDPVLSFAGRRGGKHMCFANAGRMAGGAYTYVEGYVLVYGVPIQHAWCMNKQGMVIDPTLQYGDSIEEYYGVPIKDEYLRKATLRNKVWGLLDAMSNPDILTADVKDIVAR